MKEECDFHGYVEENRPLPSNEEFLVNSDTPSSKHIWYGTSAITGLSATSTQRKLHKKLTRLTPESYHSAEAVNGRALSRKVLFYELQFL